MYRWTRLLVPLVLTPTRSTTVAFRQTPLFRKTATAAASSPLTTRTMSTTTTTEDVIPGRPTWQQTMLRIRDPVKSIAFYENLGFTLIDSFDFPQYKFSLYFMTTIPEGETYDLKPGTQAAHDYLWNMEGVALELTHNHGTEADPEAKYHPGNQEKDGFGHVAVNVDDVYASSAKLEGEGCSFKKKPDEGRMKGKKYTLLTVTLVGDGVSLTFRGSHNHLAIIRRQASRLCTTPTGKCPCSASWVLENEWLHSSHTLNRSHLKKVLGGIGQTRRRRQDSQ